MTKNAVVVVIGAVLVFACGDTVPLPKAPTALAGAGAHDAAHSSPACVAAPIAMAKGDQAVAHAVEALSDRYVAALVGCSPETATALGLHENDDRLDTRDAAAEDDCLRSFDDLLDDVEGTVRAHESRLTPSERVEVELLRGAIRTRVRTTRQLRPLALVPTTYTDPFQALFAMMAREYAPANERATRLLARLDQVPGVVALAKKNLTAPPRVFTEVGIERAKSAKAFFGDVEAFLNAALPADKTRVAKSVKAARDSYADYASFLERTVLPRSRGSYAIGKALFEFMLRESYFVNASSDDLFAMGKATMAKTVAEMNVVAKRIDPNANSWVDVVAAEKKKHPKAPDLIEAYRKEVLRARAFLSEHGIVSFPEGDDLEVIATPVFLRSTIQAAYDMPPPFDRSTKGFFFVTPVEPGWSAAKKEAWLSESDYGDLVDTAVHEAYPGHHLQLSFARRHPSKLRRVLDSAIFSEGWALYGEELMAELGYYNDSERLMQLEWTLVRAARVVIDVGLHTRNMTIPEAVKVLHDDVHLGRDLATNEVKRYAMSPTQPLSYLTGREAIFALRERVKQAQGAEFSLKRFHDLLLSKGSVPPGLIERELFPPTQKVR